MRARRLCVALAAAGLCVVPAASVSEAGSVRVRQLVALGYDDGAVSDPGTGRVHVRVDGRRCAVAGGTALAALVRSEVSGLRLRDFGSCSSRSRDGGGLFVTSLLGLRNKGERGWVYKVGTKAATAGAADVSGPFGRGRLRAGAKIVWFYCRSASNCQRTLATRVRVEEGGTVAVRVTSYDDAGRGRPAAGAEVVTRDAVLITDADGLERTRLPSGTHVVSARQRGLVPSLPEKVKVP